MRETIEIRDGGPGDLPALEMLYPAAFPDEDLVPLVRDLMAAGGEVLSLAALSHGRLVGHIAFTRCRIAGRSERVDLLAPLVVAPARQQQGIGGALVREGLRRLRTSGSSLVLVAGDPAYYGRFGFEPDARVAPPYPLPEAWRGAWRSLRLGNLDPPLTGVLEVPPYWMKPSLWSA